MYVYMYVLYASMQQRVRCTVGGAHKRSESVPEGEEEAECNTTDAEVYLLTE